ncbi:MFS transporter [Streptomyces sp. NPDC054864]
MPATIPSPSPATSAASGPGSHQPPPPRAARRMPATAGFWLLAATLISLMAASSAPTPFYAVFQQRWGFSAAVVTLVFAVYALALLLALLTVGALSDHVGRRPVLLAALALQTVAMILFLAADGPGLLLAARAVQGLATGAATGAISAGLADLQPTGSRRLGATLNSVSPPAGIAAGGILGGLVLQFLPVPDTTLFTAFTALFALLTLATVRLPETSPRRPGALASLPPRVAVPAEARPAFLRAAPTTGVIWTLLGLHLSLGPSLVKQILHIDNALADGVAVAALTGTGALVGILARPLAPRTLSVAGTTILAAGTALVVVSLSSASPAWYFTGTVIAGAGFGMAFFGSFGLLGTVVTARRAELYSSFYIVSYLTLSIPVIAAGLLVPVAGLQTVAQWYAAAVIVLALAAAALGTTGHRTHPATPTITENETA